MRTRQLTLCAVALLALVLSGGCHSQEEAASSYIRIGIESEPLTLDPHAHNDGATWTVQANLYEGLVSFDPYLKIVPALAQKWENPDGVTWHFFLRPGVRFHNGRTLSAADVVYSLRHASKDPLSQVRTKLAGVVDVSEVAPDAVEIKTQLPEPALLNKLTSIYIISRAATEHKTESFSGTGPYEVESWNKGQLITLKRFENYWGNRPAIDRVSYVPLTDKLLRADSLLKNQVDLLRGLTSDSIQKIAKNPDKRIIVSTGTTTTYLGFGYGRKGLPFDDLRFRKALYYALDVRKLGASRAPQDLPNQPIPASIFGYNAHLVPRRHDAKLAAELLRETEWNPATRLVLDMPINSEKQFGGWIREELGEIGLNIEVHTSPWKEFYGRLVAGQLSFYLTAWSCSSGDAGEFLDSCIHSRGGGYGDCNVGNYSNPELDHLIEISRSTMNDKERQAGLQEIMQHIMENLPIIPLDYLDEYYGARRNIEWRPRADGRILASEIRLVPDSAR